MTTSQYLRLQAARGVDPLVATLAWGCFAYRAMPQRHDPIIPIRIATVVTIYPGADAEKVEQEVTRKIEKQVALCDNVDKVRSLSRQNFSVVFVDLFERVKDPEQVWQDLQGPAGVDDRSAHRRRPAASARKSTRISARPWP